MLGSPSSYMTLQRLSSEFPIYEENFLFFFISVFQLEGRGEKHTVLEFYNNLWGLGTEQEQGCRQRGGGRNILCWNFITIYGGQEQSRNMVVVQATQVRLHCKKRLTVIPSLARMSFHYPNSPWPGIIEVFPARESLVRDILAGDGKNDNLFLQCRVYISGQLAWVRPQ